jgi:hypothetical protein
MPVHSSSPAASTFACPAPTLTPQNGKAERIIRSINNVIRSLLFQASMPPSYWVEALSTATSLINILPTKTLGFSTPHLALLGTPPAYAHLRVFGCKCYPNLSATAPHKLTPRSALCVFLGYSAHHKGYRCLDTSSLMRLHFLSLSGMAPPHLRPSSFWMHLTLCSLLLDRRTSSYLQDRLSAPPPVRRMCLHVLLR